MIKKRSMKPSKRGLYIQDKELLETVFQPSTAFTYEIDLENRVIMIKPAKVSKNRVSKRALKTGTIKPVIDIRNSEIKELLAEADTIEITIDTDSIYVKIGQNSTLYELSKDSVPSFYVAKKPFEPLALTFDVLSLFSGSGLLDRGFIEAGFNIKLAVELNNAASKTHMLNHCGDVWTVDIRQIKKENLPNATVIIGGTPCQSFSNANRTDRFIDHPNNLLVLEFIDAVRANEECKIFVLENVPEILTCGNGKFLKEIEEELSDFSITSGVLNSENFRDPQARERAFIIGSKIGKVTLPIPTNKTPVTVGEALANVDNLINQNDFTLPKPETIEKMRFVKQGGNWLDIPKLLLGKGFGKNTHSNIYRRLQPDAPSITLPNVRKSNILHPTEHRVLSVRECARLFSLPDDFLFTGNLSEMQQQVCNGVPVKLAKSVASAVKRVIEKFNSSQLIYC